MRRRLRANIGELAQHKAPERSAEAEPLYPSPTPTPEAPGVGTFGSVSPSGRWVPFVVETYTLEPSYPPHRHEYSEITFVLSGQGTHDVEGASYPLGVGEVFVILPGVVHELRDCKQLTHTNLYFDAARYLPSESELADLPAVQRLFARTPAHQPFGNRMQLQPKQMARVSELLLALAQERKQSYPGYETMLRAIFHELLVLLSRYDGIQQSASGDARIDRALEYIEQNFLKPITLKELAAHVELSVSQLLRRFGALYATSPMDYAIELRMRLARELLADVDYSITSIAHEVGYADSNYFAQAFRRHHSKSPTEYRRAIRAGAVECEIGEARRRVAARLGSAVPTSS